MKAKPVLQILSVVARGLGNTGIAALSAEGGKRKDRHLNEGGK